MRLTMPSKSSHHRFRTILRSTFALALSSSSSQTATSFSIAASVNTHTQNHLNHFNTHPLTFVRGGSIATHLLKKTATITTQTNSAHSPQSKRRKTAMSASNDEGSADVATADATKTSYKSGSGELLAALRAEMKKKNVDAYVIPSDDPHLSEYVADAYGRRCFVTGFDGSAGTALVTEDAAYLWTDSRYWNQANLQLDSEHWQLMKLGQTDAPTLPKFVADLANKKYTDSNTVYRLGLDPYVHAASFEKEMETAYNEAADDDEKTIGVIDTLDGSENLVDIVWGEQRPPVPKSPFRVHPLKYAGVSVADKIKEIRSQMKEKKVTLSVFSTLDDIAYLFNIRAMGDVFSCPVGIAYGTITLDGDVTLYCDDAKVQSEEVKEHLKEAGVTLAPYENIVPDVEAHCSKGSANGESTKPRVWLDKSRCNYAISRVIPTKSLYDKQNAVTSMKACKNEVELEGMRQAHIVDGVAMAHAISQLEDTVLNKGEKVSEVDVDLIITGERAKQPGFLEVSFPTIAGVGSNGAIIHYRAEDNEIMQYLDTSNPILIDSGGQYEYGTTDVTRTWHFGEGTDEFKDVYTRVLKGNIGMDTMTWPENTPGFVLDVFARKWLWEAGKDYGHGTGHGVGAALNVHEGPMSISARWKNLEVLKAGMVLSNEPGYYEDGNFGIRIENLMEVCPASEEEPAPGAKNFFKFKKLTMIPIQKSLIKTELMTDVEMDWLDEYHDTVWKNVSPLLEEGSAAWKWLEKSCTKIDRSSN